MISTLLALAASAALTPAADVLVPAGASWSYLDDGSDQGTAWRAPGFDDSAWAGGDAELGYGDGDEATVVGFGGDPNDKFVTTYFRHDFDVADPTLYHTLGLGVVRDDGVAVYLNGVEVARDCLAPGATYDELALHTISSGEEEVFYRFYVDPALLQAGPNVLAVEVHQADVGSSDISFDLELVGHTAPFVARGPYLQVGTDTSIRVRWRAHPASDSVVWYGDAPNNLTQSVIDTSITTEHEVELTGLTPDTFVYYAVGDSSGVLAGGDADHFFRTAPPAGTVRPVRVWVVGDSGTQDANAAAVRDAYANFTAGTHTDVWLMLGDNAYGEGTDVQFQAAVFDMYPQQLRQTVVWPTRGNHERTLSAYYGGFSMPTLGEAGGVASGTEAYYSFDHANLHFVCLDSYGSSRAVGGAMWTWLEADLAANLQPWIVAYWHHPPYSKGSHDSDTEVELIEMRENFLPLLESYGVDLVLCGHSHSYERSFLLDGHYGSSDTLTDDHKVDPGNGKPKGTGAYNKAAGPNAGAVYTVAGSSGKTSSGDLDHPVMVTSVQLLGSVVLDVDGGQLRQRFLRDTGKVADRYTLLNDTYEGTYCVSPIHSEGCAGELSSSGTPSATDPAPFWIDASLLPENQFALLFYGYGPANGPFVGEGSLCVGGSLLRTGAFPTGGGGPCTGSVSYDFNARIQSGVDSGLVPGAVVYCQVWFRDPSGPSGTALTDALQFFIRP